MKSVLIALAFFSCGLGTALAAGDVDAPVHWNGQDIEVIMGASMKPIIVVSGNNFLDKLRTFTCQNSAGCRVVTSASDKETDTNDSQLCTLIDGVEGAPGCAYEATSTDSTKITFANEQMEVKQGKHTIQTTVTAQAGGQILGWQVSYTIYERKVRGAD
jgi:hypothetical protein